MPEKESLDVSARTIEEAVEQGLKQLGLSRGQVDVEIVSEGKRGLFGLGSEEATVRLTPRILDQGESEPPVEEAPAEVAKASPAESQRAAAQSTPAEAGNQALEEIGVEHLSHLLRLMGIEASVETRVADDLVEPGDEPPLVFDVKGKDLGMLIGRRNETLQALQFMVRLMVNKEIGSWQPLVVDVESYRARRRQSLRKMAERMAERAVANDERVVLEAMPAYERRIIHIALRDHPDVITKSVGRDKSRKVTIIPK